VVKKTIAITKKSVLILIICGKNNYLLEIYAKRSAFIALKTYESPMWLKK
jgi:hypothetical protein